MKTKTHIDKDGITTYCGIQLEFMTRADLQGDIGVKTGMPICKRCEMWKKHSETKKC